MSGLVVDRLVTRYGDRTVLDGVSLAVGPGEVVSLVGPSGSGKSTLLKVLTGAAEAASGTATFGGAPLDRASRPVAFMPQRDTLLPWRHALENASIGLEVAGVPRREARRRAGELFDVFGLAGAERRYPRQLSGGMRQRVSLLRTVVQGRPLLLLDEPFGALDAITRDELQSWLLGLWGEHRWSMLLVTHDIREAVRLSDRVHVLSPAPARIVGGVEVGRDLPRDERFAADARVPGLEARVRELLHAGLRG